jgi:hypothetical protein
MSQLIAYRSIEGIVLAADSKAVEFDFSGRPVEQEIQRLFQLSEHTAILVGGAAKAAEMGQNLKDFLAEEKIDGIEEVYNASLAFLSNEFEQFMREQCDVLPVDPILTTFFVLAGQTSGDKHRSSRLHLIWNKKKLPNLDGDEISVAYSVPRLMTFELKLNQFAKEATPLDVILQEMKNTMETLAEVQEEIGPPFHYAVITAEGFRKTL